MDIQKVKTHKYLVLIPAILIGLEGAFLIICAIIKGAALSSLLDLLLYNTSSFYGFYILVGIVRIVSAVYGGTGRRNFNQPAELTGFGTVLMLSSFLGLASYLMLDPTVGMDPHWIVAESALACILSIFFLIGITKRSRKKDL